MKRFLILASVAVVVSVLSCVAHAQAPTSATFRELARLKSEAKALAPGVERCRAEALPSCAALLDSALAANNAFRSKLREYCDTSKSAACEADVAALDVEVESIKAARAKIK